MPHTQEEENAFIEGFHGIPSEITRRAMSDVELASALAESDRDSAKFIALDLELARRKNAQQYASQGNAQPSPDHWYKKPIAVICISVASALVTACMLYLVAQHFGIALK